MTAGNVAVIAAGSKPGKLLLCFYFGTTGTVTMKAGAGTGSGSSGPAQRADMGDSAALSVASGTVKCLAVDASRYAQANGTLRCAIATNTAVVTALQISEAP